MWLLCGVRVIRACVDLEFRQLLAGQAVAGEHPLDRQPDDLLGPAIEHLLKRARAQSARITRVAVVALGLKLVARYRDLLGIDDDDEIACVDVRRVGRLALAAQGVSDLRGEPPERLPGGIDEQPAALSVCRCSDVGLHGPHKPRDVARLGW